ncbi:2-(3-amino-3-carboxypropyl)histidine synthase subunit 2 isoform X1 [Homalodisca vitripennis]|uniref:2-(3-amino-3-carboxypropyl)histidine synthase subunit 2 isoform X1 n=2 Tax=Homalodisca vitripennis TaxID=197043 RepID=UPI001EE9F80F|nr:2-(3-amino-3-carboxypropyl)histidine synthase subunit 2 isoform X1 [Homalodisca vitripennis]
MDLFSSCPEETINRKSTCISNEFVSISDSNFDECFDLDKCQQFIKKGNFTKICLQFPDNLLQYSVKAALQLESRINQKVFVLGDTSYGSCCVDEVAAQHVDGDAVIHMGHTCLSPTTRLPVLHLLPRASLDLSGLVSAFAHFYSTTNGPVLLLYDVAYGHLIDEIRERLDEFKERVVISQLNIPDGQLQACGLECDLHRGSNTHQTTLLGRSYCCQSPSSVVYITHRHSQNMLNFALSMRNIQFFTYPRETEKATEDFNKSFRRRLYLVEKIKDAKTLGILVGTLSVEKYLGAIEKMKKLATYRGKRCYIFSIGKPNPAKLANFPEVEVFVLVSCPESILENEKDYMQPVVTLLEAELALNPSMHWDDQLSVDFRDLLEGNPLPENQEPLAPDVSLISNKIRTDVTIEDSGTGSELANREHYQISVANSYIAGRSWRGLEQALGETPVSQVKVGRAGIPLAYDDEKSYQPS